MGVKENLKNVRSNFDKMTTGKRMMVAAQAGLLFVAAAGGAVLSKKILANAASVDTEIAQFRDAAKEALLAGKTTLVFMDRDIELKKEKGQYLQLRCLCRSGRGSCANYGTADSQRS